MFDDHDCQVPEATREGRWQCPICGEPWYTAFAKHLKEEEA